MEALRASVAAAKQQPEPKNGSKRGAPRKRAAASTRK
jgi:hypothetical protein